MRLFAILLVLLISLNTFAGDSLSNKSIVFPNILAAMETYLNNEKAESPLEKELHSLFDRSGVDKGYIKKIVTNFYSNRFIGGKDYFTLPKKDKADLLIEVEYNKLKNILRKEDLTEEKIEKVLHGYLLGKKLGTEKMVALGYQITAEDAYYYALLEGNQINNFANIPEGDFELPELGFHAYKLDIIEEDDDLWNDNIYCYFFTTDGVIPSGKVTSIYKGNNQGDSFFFNEIDRVLFPVPGIVAAKPNNHLIVDYGIIESDGDDIKNMQKISGIIIDIAVVVFAAAYPEVGPLILELRQEVKNLANALLELNHDDRLATGSVHLSAKDMAAILSENSYYEFSKTHKGTHGLSNWEYKMHFRLLKHGQL